MFVLMVLLLENMKTHPLAGCKGALASVDVKRND